MSEVRRTTVAGPSLARIAIVAAAVLWSLSGALAKSLQLPGPTMACYRALFAAAVLALFLPGRPRSFHWELVGMVTAFTIMNVAYVTAITATTAANAILLQYTAPLWMFLGGVLWLKEPLEKASMVALGLGLGGILVTLATQPPGHGIGMVLALVSGLAYGCVGLYLRRLRRHDPLWLSFLNHAGAAAILFPVLVFFHHQQGNGWLPCDLAHFAGLFVFGAVQMALPYVLFSWGLRYVSAQEAALLTLLEPVLNPLWTYLAVGEAPGTGTLIGGAFILVAVGLRYLRPWTARWSEPTGTVSGQR
jgi:DME family drug/metabolite transporter